MFSFSDTSLQKKQTIDYDLQIILDESIRESQIDFGISEGYRSPEAQFILFKKGRKLIDGIWVVVNEKEVVTNIDGYTLKGNHNYYPSLAVDIFVHVEGKPNLRYDKVHLAYLGGLILTKANALFKRGIVTHKIRWGGNWDGDGELLYDQKLKDMPHFEIIT